jgi:hypothetical protein
MRTIGKLSGFVKVILKFGSKYPTIKKNVIKPIPPIRPGFVQSLHIPNFRFILSNQSVGGKTRGVKIDNKVKLIVGVESASITDLNVSIIRISNQSL